MNHTYNTGNFRNTARKVWGVLIVLLGFALPVAAQNCQTIIANVNSTSPAPDPVDTVIKICKGTTVSFNGSASFTGSSAGATYEWKFKDGPILPGTNVSRTFTDEGVYVVDFVVHDANGCVNKNCNSRRVIYVSTTPYFTGTTVPDTICLHREATLTGVVVPVPGEYDCAPPVADTTFLPDGSGGSYTTSINVTCFTPCDTVRDSLDIQSICITMEHSYLGDLDAKIICPNGQEANLFYTFNSAAGGTFLGVPVDVTPFNGPIDNEYCSGTTYCFSPTATWGPFVNMLANTTPVSCIASNASTTTGNSLIGGDYRPQGSYNSLVGCPLNGNWTIQVTDHLNADNGHIFNWSINFSHNLGNYSFLPTYPSRTWNAHPDIIANTGGNATIKPETNGNSLHCYTFKVVDGFNCPYDTTLCVYVVDPGNPGKDTTAKLCLNEDPVNAFNYLGGNPEPGGTWSGSVVTPGGIFNPAAAGIGTHEVVYTKRRWNCDTTATITFKVVNDVKVDFDFVVGKNCTLDTVFFTNLSDSGRYWWNFADGTMPEDTSINPVHIYQDQDIYNVRLTVKNLDGCIDSVIKPVDVRHPLIAAFSSNIDSICQTAGTPIQFTDGSTGAITGRSWNFDDGGTSTLEDPTHIFSLAGNRSVRLIIHDAIPCYDTVYHNIYVDSLPFLSMVTDRHAICAGEKVNFTADYLHPAVALNWDFGDGIHWLQGDATSHNYEQPGLYHVTVTAQYPVCADTVVTDSVVVNSFPVVYLGPDSVLCLDGPAITVTDQHNVGDPAMTWLWSTGAVTPSINIVHPGTYSVTAMKNDCSTTENIVVNKDCYTDIPNAFTPNGDGQNDYFFPRQLLSEGVKGFTMLIFNRWGQKVFETSNASGRGWDGKFNDKDQPLGVYLYQIKVVMKNGRIEDYTGNVTLVR